MKRSTFAKWSLLAFLGLAIGAHSESRANPVGTLQGPFSIQPLVYHPSAITGQMAVRNGASQVEKVQLSLDQPVLGMKNFESKEQWSGQNGQGTAAQTVLAFKLEGPTHGWYFVWVATSADGGQTLSGAIYKAKAKLSEIQTVAQSPIGVPPATWKNVGSATLKHQ